VKLRTNWRIAAQTVLVAFMLQTVAKAGPSGSAPPLHFVCNIGYTLKQCHEAMDVLRKVLAKYPTADLGEWTWILVLPDDWGHIMQDRGWSPNRGPAFSILSLRETFLEGALVTKLSVRGDQLSTLWRMPIEDLLDLAVRHELGHALCNERNGAQAGRIAAMLQERKPISCEVQTAGQRSPPTLRSDAR
jgi:hypothetical protein